MGRNHTAAMLSPEGLKTSVLPHRNSFPNIFQLEAQGAKSIVYELYVRRAKKGPWVTRTLTVKNVVICHSGRPGKAHGL